MSKPQATPSLRSRTSLAGCRRWLLDCISEKIGPAPPGGEKAHAWLGHADPSQVERVKGCVVLNDPPQAGPATEMALVEHCQQQLFKWSCPREVEFRADLPKTRVRRIDYNVLVQEHIAANGKKGTA